MSPSRGPLVLTAPLATAVGASQRRHTLWLCKLAERGMLRPSFVPPPAIQRLRDLTRYRADLVAVQTASGFAAEPC